MLNFNTNDPLFDVSVGELLTVRPALRACAARYPLGYVHRFGEYYQEILNAGWHVDWEQLCFDNLLLMKQETFHIHVYFRWNPEFDLVMQLLLKEGLYAAMPENLKPRLTKMLTCYPGSEAGPVFKFGQMALRDELLVCRIWATATADIEFMIALLNSKVLSDRHISLIHAYLNKRYEYFNTYECPEPQAHEMTEEEEFQFVEALSNRDPVCVL